MTFLDFSDPFYRPVWIRIAIVAICVVWGLIELVTGALFWAVLFIGVGCVAGWRFATIDYSEESDD